MSFTVLSNDGSVARVRGSDGQEKEFNLSALRKDDPAMATLIEDQAAKQELAGTNPGAAPAVAGPEPVAAPQPATVSAPAAPEPMAPMAPRGPAIVPLTTTQTATTITPVSKEEKQAIKLGMEAVKSQAAADEAAILANQAKEQQALVEAATLQEQANSNARMLDEFRQRQMQRVTDQMTKVNTAVDQMAAFEPKDFWADKASWQKVTSAIGIALGGLGQAFTGGENQALKIIDSAIQRDSMMQKLRYDKLGRLVDVERAKLGDIRTQVNDDLLFQDSMMAAKYKAAEKYVDRLMQSTSDGQVKAKLAGVQAQLQARTAELQAKMGDRVSTVVQSTTKPELVGGSGPQFVENETKLRDLFQNDKVLGKMKESTDAADRFEALARGNQGAALIDFIATGLKQGSFGPEMVNLLQKEGLIGKGGEFLREKAVGGFNPNLVADVQSALDAEAKRAVEVAQPRLNKLASQFGPDSLEAYSGKLGGRAARKQENQKKASDAGLKPVSIPKGNRG